MKTVIISSMLDFSLEGGRWGGAMSGTGSGKVGDGDLFQFVHDPFLRSVPEIFQGTGPFRRTVTGAQDATRRFFHGVEYSEQVENPDPCGSFSKKVAALRSAAGFDDFMPGEGLQRLSGEVNGQGVPIANGLDLDTPAVFAGEHDQRADGVFAKLGKQFHGREPFSGNGAEKNIIYRRSAALSTEKARFFFHCIRLGFVEYAWGVS
jgi:hypothetical protein